MADIVGIPFPYSDLSTRKRRPVLALTRPDSRGDFISLPVTSVQTECRALCIKSESLKEGDLPKISWVRCDKVFTLSSFLVNKKYGRLQDDVFRRIMDKFCTCVGCF